MLYKTGKARLCKTALKALSQLLGYRDKRQIKIQIEKLETLKWIHYNSKTGYYTIKSFETIRKYYRWKSRYSISCSLKDVSNIYGVVGGALYLFLHRLFWNKVNRERIVRLKGRTYHSLSRPLLPFSTQHAPIATTGVSKLYNISISKASRLKHAAERAGYIEVKKDYLKLPCEPGEVDFVKKYNSEIPNLLIIEGKIYLQLIDLILPKIALKKRQKLKT